MLYIGIALGLGLALTVAVSDPGSGNSKENVYSELLKIIAKHRI